MDNFLGWLRDVFKNDDIVSALTGETVEPPISDPKRKRNTQISTAVGYVTLFAVIVFLSTILPEPPKLARNPDLPNLIFVMTEGPGGGGGGGGELTEDPASVQKIEGQDQAKIAIEIESPEDKLIFEDPDRPPEVEEEKEVVEEDEVPEIVAPVVAQAPDDTTERGILEGQEQLGELPHLPLLRGGNRLEPPAERPARSRLHLAEHDQVVAPGDEVELARAAAPVAREEIEPQTSVERGGCILACPPTLGTRVDHTRDASTGP